MTTLPEETAAPGARGHAHALMVLGLPLIGSHLAQYAVQVTDAVMLGRYDLGDLAAQTVAGAIYFVFFIVGSGFAWAVMPMVAAAAGTDDDVQVRRVTRMGIWLSVLFGLAALPVLVFSEPLLILMGQEPLVAARGALYLKIVGIGLIPNLLIMVVKSYLAALGRTRIVFVVIAVTAALNVLLNYVLIFGNWGAPELGIAGAAIASVTLQVVGFLWLAIYAARVTPEYELFRNPWRADWEAFGRVFRLGWPIGLTNLAEVGLFAASSVMVGWIGVKELAAHGIALQIASGTFMIHIGLSQAVTVRAGRAYGRRDREGLRLGAAVGFGLSMAVVAVTVIAFLTVPGLLIAPFVSADDPARPEIMAIGAALLAVAALFQAVDAGQVMALGMLRGVQDTRVPMVIAGLSYWAVGVPASYALGFWAGLGAVGVWLGLVMGLALAGVFLTWRFWGRASSPAALGA
ncbi:MATE family efflux transporter [Ovoidimarina sediminis]|uniref:MATE family efflux transporter n=1 Tax=Ovoidimarina sediminis TaxID=3079856 RepID=UPI002908C431|nr:MATE family efflux transporter [Rhodophyticola sp. MJ-SS7]MDU8942319.1 MATE family efflux transporter [Rhodophyticola sp. MJ-SS7]